MSSALEQRPLIAFKGRAGAGKSTATGYLIKALQKKGKRAFRMSFAAPLKKTCAEIFGTAFDIDSSAFFGSQEEKNAPLPQIPGWSGRMILQHIGTEGFRHVSKDVWPKYAINKALTHLELDGYDHMVFDDLRFLSEAEAIKAAGGYIIEMVGGHDKQGGQDQGIKGHASEAEVALINADLKIVNDTSLEDLQAKLEALL